MLPKKLQSLLRDPTVKAAENCRAEGYATPLTEMAIKAAYGEILFSGRLSRRYEKLVKDAAAAEASAISVITNGNMWRVFENGNGLMRNNNILAVSIMSDPADRCAKGLARLLSPPRATIAMPFGEKTRRNQPAHGGIPTTGHLLDAAYGPLFTSPDPNRDAAAQPDAGTQLDIRTQPGVEQPPLL